VFQPALLDQLGVWTPDDFAAKLELRHGIVSTKFDKLFDELLRVNGNSWVQYSPRSC
jgi:hypothetical protein